MEDFDYDEFLNDVRSQKEKTAQDIMDYKLNIVFNRDWKKYLASIEWDVFDPITEEEHQEKLRLKQLAKHPFKKFF